MVERLLEKITAKDLQEGGVSTSSLLAALTEMRNLGDSLIAWTELRLPICVLLFVLLAPTVLYADLVWAVWCFGEGEHASGDNSVIEIPEDQAKADADREAFRKHPFGLALTTTPAGKLLRQSARDQLIRRKDEGAADAAFARAEEER